MCLDAAILDFQLVIVNVGAELVSGQFGENRAFRRHRRVSPPSARPAVAIKRAACIFAARDGRTAAHADCRRSGCRVMVADA